MKKPVGRRSEFSDGASPSREKKAHLENGSHTASNRIKEMGKGGDNGLEELLRPSEVTRTNKPHKKREEKLRGEPPPGKGKRFF